MGLIGKYFQLLLITYDISFEFQIFIREALYGHIERTSF